jgi:uncharacterized protein YegL
METRKVAVDVELVVPEPMGDTNRRRWLIGGASALVLAAVVAPGCGGSEGSEFGDPNAGSGTSGGPSGPGFDLRDGSTDADSGQDPLKNSCATASAEARRLPVYMQFIIDGSGSMDGFDGVGFIPGEREADPLSPGRQTGKKWIAVRGALQAFFDDLAAKPDPSFAVGMYLFSSTAVKPPTAVDVPIKLVDMAQATALKTRLAPPVFPNGGTPLCGSIDGQLAILKAYKPTAPVQTGGKYVLVAMTDGIPTDTKTACLASVTAAKTGTPPVATFAVGVGNEDADPATVYDEVFMKDLANAGGTAVPGCNPSWGNADKTGKPCHFQITPGTKTAVQIKADFLAAINAIRDAVASCEFPLTRPPGSGAIDPANVNVIMTTGGVDKTIPQDAKDGWTYDDPVNPTKVFLHGKACDALKADPAAKIKIVVGCKTVTDPTK